MRERVKIRDTIKTCKIQTKSFTHQAIIGHYLQYTFLAFGKL